MFMAFRASPRHKPLLLAAALSLLFVGTGIALSLG
jgi:hypothetical protein